MPSAIQTSRRSGEVAARRIAAAVGVLIVVAALLANSGTASAHTGFESSTPAEGSAIDEPVELVTIVFTGEATPVGEEFVALTPDGVVQQAASFETVDDKTFTVRFDPPLAGGQVGIRWNVQSADGHPIEGAFSFTVAAPAPDPPTTDPPATTAATTLPQTSTPVVVEAVPPDTSDAAVAQVTEEAAEETVAPLAEADNDSAIAADSDAGTVAGVAVTQSLDEFITVDDSVPGGATATIGRLVGFGGVVIGLGVFAFITTTLRGRRQEVRQALRAIRVLGTVIALGAAIEYIGVTRIGGASLADGWSSAPGVATVLRLVGGVGLALGIAGTISPGETRSLSAAVIDDDARQPAPTASSDVDHIVRWIPNARSRIAFAAAALIIVSFWFDGHTVSKGVRPLHSVVNSVHVVAGAVWVGGVVAMAAVVWSRFRSQQPMRVVELVVRFSKIATIVLAATVVAGGVMAFLVLDSFRELTGTPWGKTLLLKTGAVCLAMCAGAYNHFRLLPALEADPESPRLLAQLRGTITAEAIVLTFVVAVTAWLVAAAS